MQNKKKSTGKVDEHLKKPSHYAGKIVATVLLCSGLSIGSYSVQAEDTLTVKVYFDGTCPKYVDQPFFELNKEQKKDIEWVAHNAANGQATPDLEFDVFFHPFVGPDTKFKKGKVTSPNIDKDLPDGVTYKYTVVGKGCDIGLDPFFRVQ